MNLFLGNTIYDDVPQYERYNSADKVPGYDDLTELWVLKNEVSISYNVIIDDVDYLLKYSFRPGLITDKASTPGSSSDWYPAIFDYLVHDVNFSCHYLGMFSSNYDDGFRATNLLFREGIR